MLIHYPLILLTAIDLTLQAGGICFCHFQVFPVFKYYLRPVRVFLSRRDVENSNEHTTCTR